MLIPRIAFSSRRPASPNHRMLVLIMLVSAAGACAPHRDVRSPVHLIPDATYVGSEECAVCHDDVFEYYRKTIHYRVRAFEVTGQERGCEGCHGPGSAHVASKGKIEQTISFDRLTPAEGTAICLTCHRNDPLLSWEGSMHALHDVGCNQCHKSHKITEEKMLYKGEPALCYDCHQQMKMQAEMPSHHPVREGRMNCSACHSAHGAEENGLKDITVNDLCYECHTDKQGPFLYEHPPVEEACDLCHDVHGTVANNLLQQDEPFLCLRCHRGHKGFEGTGSHPSLASMMTSCTQCHSQIHGSDLYSQLGKGGLTR